MVVTIIDGTSNHVFTVIRRQQDVHVHRELNNLWCRLLTYLQ